ncbi:MAG: hypothetical protein ABH914_00025 [Candidatus Omnitrophota bacterium]
MFTHIIFGLLTLTSLLSLHNDFGDSRLFIVFIIAGLTTSWRQQKRNKPIPYLKTILNIVFIAITIKALLPFFTANPTDILGGLIKTWIYFLILSTFNINTKRDYHIIQALSLGIIVFSCFNQTAPEITKLAYILLFFIIWIVALRGINLTKDIEGTEVIHYHKGWLYQEIKTGILFVFFIIILAVPIYMFIPHFNFTLPFFTRFVEQKTNISADYPGSNIISFLDLSSEKISGRKKQKAKAQKIAPRAKTELIDIQKFRDKPLFWHSAKEYENKLRESTEKMEQTQSEISGIDQELQEISREEEMPQIDELVEERKRLLHRKEVLEKNLEKMQKKQTLLKDKYLNAVREESFSSIKEPESSGALQSLKEEIRELEKNLEESSEILKTQKEELSRINAKIDEIRISLYQETKETASGKRVQKIWIKKEVLEESLGDFKKETGDVKEEYAQYNQLIKENAIQPIIADSLEEYENILQESTQQAEQAKQEIAVVNKELGSVSRETQLYQIEKLTIERNKLNEKKEELKKTIETLQEEQALVEDKCFKALEEKRLSSINEPENTGLIEKLKEDVRELDNKLENMAKKIGSLQEELAQTVEGLDEVRGAVFRESVESSAGTQIQKAWINKEVLEEKLGRIKNKITEIKSRLTDNIVSQIKQEDENLEKKDKVKKDEKKLIDLLFRFLILIILLTLLFLLYCIIAFFLPYLKEKNKFKRLSKENKHNLCITLLYNFLCRVLIVFGYKYPLSIDPEEQLIKVARRYQNLRSDLARITNLFLEARYSTHKMIKEQEKKALSSYTNILKELKSKGSFWQQLILKFDFLFKF